jgi:hypothetical protein
MALKKPIANYSGNMEELRSGDDLDVPTTGPQLVSFTNANASPITQGMVVYLSAADNVDIAKANAIGTIKPIAGLVNDASIAASASGYIVTDGPLTVSDWTAVVGGTTLTAGAEYFVSAATAGKLTATAPSASGNIVQKIGYAINTTTMMVRIGQPLTLA